MFFKDNVIQIIHFKLNNLVLVIKALFTIDRNIIRNEYIDKYNGPHILLF